MIHLLPLADISITGIGPTQPAPISPEFRSMLIIMAALVGVAAIVFGWAVFIRKKPRHRKYRHSSSPRESGEGSGAANDNVSESVPDKKKRRKWRRPRRPHRSINPTLAETGGLPPVRDGQSSEPSQ